MKSQKEYIAHVRPPVTDSDSWRIQTLESHSHGVAELAKGFASEFGMGEWGYLLGILHDKGKEQQSFQDYIRRESGYDLSAPVLNGRDKSHAYVGALLAHKLYGKFGQLIDNQIAGHHSGLYDYTELEMVLSQSIPSDVNDNLSQINLSIDKLQSFTAADINHLYRLLYSCLVDADFLDTERFMHKESYDIRQNTTTMMELKERLNAKLEAFKQAPETPVNKIRQEIQKVCLGTSTLPPGFFSLTVPTGGGKTIASVVWAINHAIKNGKKRIIIAIPYTSIIVQTAAVLKGIFGENNVLEQHSNFDYEQVKNPRLKHQLKLATENWDYPIIVATNVQLFESLYSNKPANCRRLHNICNSVLILDEVQTLPIDFLQPIVDSLKCYQQHFGMSVLFTTASQPILSGIIEGCNSMCKFHGIEHIQEIIPKGMNLHESLKRVKLEISKQANTYDEVAAELACHDKVLCIVNTRKDAKELFERLPDEGIKIHLSRMMCPAHTKNSIENIKSALKNEDNKIIRVIATQLIEAGVDIDFPVVYRQEAGLDSVLQAAGRCNREGKRSLCTTYVFSLSKEHPLYGGSLKDANNARLNIVGERDWFAPETMTEYFRQLYCRRETFDKKQIKELLYKPTEMCFETAANEFQLIDDASIPIIVNWGNSIELVELLKTEGPSYALMKRLSQYTVSVRQGDFKKLQQANIVEEILEGIFVVRQQSQYDEQVGLLTENQWLEETYIL